MLSTKYFISFLTKRNARLKLYLVIGIGFLATWVLLQAWIHLNIIALGSTCWWNHSNSKNYMYEFEATNHLCILCCCWIWMSLYMRTSVSTNMSRTCIAHAVQYTDYNGVIYFLLRVWILYSGFLSFLLTAIRRWQHIIIACYMI